MNKDKRNANSDVSLQNIVIDDAFFNKYVKIVKETIIPYQWRVLNDDMPEAESSHCIENFKIAAGLSQGTFQGAVFQDTDVAKWLEAVGFELSKSPDEALEALADQTIELLEQAQGEDGYLNTYFSLVAPQDRWQNLMEGHELYTAGHLIEAAVAYYEATGKRKVIDLVCRLADLIYEEFMNHNQGYPGHQEIELALVKLYRVTGHSKYLELSKTFIDRRGCGENYFLKESRSPGHHYIFDEFKGYDPRYSQSHQPVREQKTAEGHAVRALYMYSAMADLAYEYEDDGLLETCERLWQNIVEKRMYITGSVGSSGFLERFTCDFDLPNDRNYSETCASIGLALFGKRMAQNTKNAAYMDVVEKALYNTIIAGIAMDGQSFFYVNPLEVWPENCLEHTSMAHVKAVRQKWFGVACCPPNIARTLASLGQYLYFQTSDTLYLNLFMAHKAQMKIKDVNCEIELKGNFPWEEDLSLTISTEKAVTMTLALRIPAYVGQYEIKRNGRPLKAGQVNKGYLMIEKVTGNDHFDIHFDLSPHFVYANDQVRANIGKVALQKGPMIYCLEEVDNGKALTSIYVNPHQAIEAVYDSDLLKGVTVLKMKGQKLISDGNPESLYHDQGYHFEPVKVKAIPYAYWCNREPGEMLVWIKTMVGDHQ